MSPLFKLKMAKQQGEKLALDEGFTALAVDPFRIAASRNILVQPKPADAEGVSGMLLRHGNSVGIMYASNIRNEGFQRFSVAHELGHFFLTGHLDQILGGSEVHTSRAGFVSNDPYEMEADHFAAGLLMPERLFKPLLARREPGLAAIEEIATLAKTSLTSTAIRVAELTKDAVAAILSTGASVDYCFLSEGIKSLPNLSFIRKGSPVPRETATASFNSDPSNIRSARRVEAEIDSMDWLGGSKSIKLTEEVLGLGGYGKTLTVLSSKSFMLAEEGYDDEEQDERDLVEKYTPRFQ